MSYTIEKQSPHHMVVNLGPQHPAMHGILRVEVHLDGEIVQKAVPHIGYLHRCFEKHAEALPFPQIIPYVDRLDYLAAMHSEHAFVMGAEKLCQLPPLPLQVEYIRVLMLELNRLASHFLAIGTYGIDVGAATAFLWLMQEREHILKLLEWVSGARLLYHYQCIGGIWHDIPVGFTAQCEKFITYIGPKLDRIEKVLLKNKIFISRTAHIGVLDRTTALQYAVSGPMLRASGVALDLRKTPGYSVYPALDFQVPLGQGLMGCLGDCWDRTWVRFEECKVSISLIQQCLLKLQKDDLTTQVFNPQQHRPKKIRPIAQMLYSQAETPRGILGFLWQTQANTDIPWRCKVRAPSFSNLSVLPTLVKGHTLADLVAIVGSLDIVLGEVDR